MASPEFSRRPCPLPVESNSDISTGPVDCAARWNADAPTRWGHLENLERIGRGFFAEVYRAWDPRLEREVALKLYRPTVEGSQEWQRFGLREGRLLARIRHPNVVTIYGVDQDHERLGLCMEYIRGRTLESLLHDWGTLGAREAALIGFDVCTAVGAAHERGLLHRDIKSRNVMRESGGRIVLMDFGLGQDVRAATVDQGPRLCGTPLYMAPELLQGSQASVQSDIYSIGILLYRLVSGAFPIGEENNLDGVRRIYARGETTQLRDRRSDLPEPFLRVVERSLSPDPDKRFTTTGQMARALSTLFIDYLPQLT
jgi:serine/threonine-protein kinase